MKIKIDLAAFEALTQEQMLAIAVAESGWEPDVVADCAIHEDHESGRVYLDWKSQHTDTEMGIGLNEKYIGATFDDGFEPVMWATIEKLAEYNVITFQP